MNCKETLDMLSFIVICFCGIFRQYDTNYRVAVSVIPFFEGRNHAVFDWKITRCATTLTIKLDTGKVEAAIAIPAVYRVSNITHGG